MKTDELVHGRFLIERHAGAGGMGTVYRALDTSGGGRVALKILTETQTDDAERFAREARILSELVHPGIVRYIAHGSVPGGPRYIVTEWLEGESLADRLQRGPIGAADVIALGQRIAEILGVAHRRGIVHRDVKPANLMLLGGRIDDVKVLDFGIARDSRLESRITLAGLTMGTPGYMAPEQARGERDVDGRADVFALGCVLYECATGRPAFSGDNMLALLAKILVEDPPRASEVAADLPHGFDALLTRMLAKDPRERPADGSAAAAELAELGRGQPAAHPAPTPRLTRGEQRFSSVVLGHAIKPDPEQASSAPTVDARALHAQTVELRSAVAPLGGRLEVLADGSVLALVTGEAAVTDQAERAARCALALRRLLPSEPMALASGRGRVDERLPVGEVIERAIGLLRDARASGGPTPSGVLIDELTASLLGDRFRIERGSLLELGGETENDEGVRTLLGRPTPCVGREAELSMLEGWLDACIEEPRSAGMLVTAPPGVGKSRLRHELVTRARSRHPKLDVWVGRADSLASGSPFGLLGSALRRVFGLSAGEPVHGARQKIHARLSRHLAPNERAHASSFLCELLDVPLSDDADVELRAARRDALLLGDRMRGAFLDFVAGECAHHPVLLVLEDLHWGDQPSLGFVEAALRRSSEQPLIVLALARPEVFERFRELRDEWEIGTLRLGKLSPRACARLAGEVLGPARASQIEWVVARAGGNAFFLEELLRAVVEGRGDALPETVLATIEARLLALDHEARRVLRAASVFGNGFWRGGVHALLGGSDGSDLDHWLAALAEGELIERRPSSKFPSEDEYVFRHALLRDAAYAMLTDDDRALGHRIAASWLESVAESDAVALAEHFMRGRQPERAIAWFFVAAEHALEGHAFDDAVARAERGIAAGAQGLERGALLLVMAEAERWRGRFAEAAESARAATRDNEPGSVRWFRAVEELLLANGRLGRFDLAVPWAERAAATTPAADARSAEVVCLCSAARVLFHAGRYDLAEDLVDKLNRRVGGDAEVDPRALAELERLRGAHARHVGDPIGDLVGYQAALAAFERAGDARNSANARVSVGFAYAELGVLDRAREELERALADAERFGLSTIETRARQNLGLVLYASGEASRALPLLERTAEESRRQRNMRFEGWTRIYWSNAALAAGKLDVAESEARRATELLAVSPPARAGALAAQARALVALERLSDAATAAAEALSVLDAYGGIEEFEPLVRLAVVECALAAGDGERARAEVQLALERIETVAARIADPEVMAAFRQNVPENARLVALAGELGVEAPS